MNTKTYDTVCLADDEWGNELMREIASDWFTHHPACEFVEVREHAGWYLGFRRDHSVWATANDCAALNGPFPALWSGICYRRTEADARKEIAA